jgi:hypothetical protein
MYQEPVSACDETTVWPSEDVKDCKLGLVLTDAWIWVFSVIQTEGGGEWRGA